MNCKILFIAVLALLSVTWAEEASDVVVLTTDNFDSIVNEADIIMVEFYAPWCGHCKKLAPEYDAAATDLKKDGISIAKVDATVETELGTKYGIRGYPTIKVFKKGSSEPRDYQGERSAKAIASYMRKQLAPAVTELKTEDDVTQFQEKDRVVVVGFFESEEDSKVFKSVADELRDESFFGVVIGSSDVAQKFGAKAPGVVLFKTFDEKKAIFDGEIEAKALKDFIKTESVALLDEVGPENYKNYMDTGIPLGFLFLDPAVDNTKLKEEFTEVAKTVRGKLNLCWIDNSKYNSQAGRLGLSGSKVPSFAIDDQTKGTHYAFDETVDFTGEAVGKWIKEFTEGKIEPTIKSEEIPEKNDGPVTVLVGKNFDEIVKDSKKDVLVEFYAPWCGHCKQLAPIYEKLGESFSDVDSVVISKIDATANDVDPKYGIRGFPTLKFFPANNKESPLSYDGERTEEALADFVRKNAAVKIESKEGLKEEL